jgi:hypothetical protein
MLLKVGSHRRRGNATRPDTYDVRKSVERIPVSAVLQQASEQAGRIWTDPSLDAPTAQRQHRQFVAPELLSYGVTAQSKATNGLVTGVRIQRECERDKD